MAMCGWNTAKTEIVKIRPNKMEEEGREREVACVEWEPVERMEMDEDGCFLLPDISIGSWETLSRDVVWNRCSVGPNVVGGSTIRPQEGNQPLDIFERVVGEEMMRSLESMFPTRYLRRKRMMMFLGMKMILQGRQGRMGSKGKHSVLKADVGMLRKEIEEKMGIRRTTKGSILPGGKIFLQAMKSMCITSSMMNQYFTPNMIALLSLGEYVCVDQKYSEYSGSRRSLLFTPRKEKQKGSWVIQFVSRLQRSGLPIVIGIAKRTVIGVEGSEKVLHWWRESLKPIDPKVIYCFTKNINCRDIREYCIDHHLLYQSILPSPTIGYLHSCMLLEGNPIVKEDIYYNRVTYERIDSRRDPHRKEKRIYRMGNIYRPIGENRGEYVDIPYSECTLDVFSASEDYNRQYITCWWPYKRVGEDGHFDTLYFTTIVLNCYALWVSGEHEGEYPPIDMFYEQLGWDMISKYSSI